MVKTEPTIHFGDFVQPLETQSSVTIDPNIKFQSFLGIGAALTDAAAETFYKLDKDQQDLFLKSYFS
ncbi:MAG: glycosyl hydrolase, partial [Bacteroidota bacterium]|nr:glycosyl hydrolase [Bacteroidota bacterium]